MSKYDESVNQHYGATEGGVRRVTANRALYSRSMPPQLTDMDRLRDYIAGVMDRAGHHASGVNEIALALAGAIVWRKDEEPIEVMVRDGEMKNVLWFRVGHTRYAFSYNHRAGAIELREGTTQGQVVGSFTNSTPGSEVRRIFEQL